MRNRLLRSVLVAAISAVVAVGTMVGLSGASGDGAHTGGTRISEAASVDTNLPVGLDDSTWD